MTVARDQQGLMTVKSDRYAASAGPGDRRRSRKARPLVVRQVRRTLFSRWPDILSIGRRGSAGAAPADAGHPVTPSAAPGGGGAPAPEDPSFGGNRAVSPRFRLSSAPIVSVRSSSRRFTVSGPELLWIHPPVRQFPDRLDEPIHCRRPWWDVGPAFSPVVKSGQVDVGQPVAIRVVA